MLLYMVVTHPHIRVHVCETWEDAAEVLRILARGQGYSVEALTESLLDHLIHPWCPIHNPPQHFEDIMYEARPEVAAAALAAAERAYGERERQAFSDMGVGADA